MCVKKTNLLFQQNNKCIYPIMLSLFALFVGCFASQVFSHDSHSGSGLYEAYLKAKINFDTNTPTYRKVVSPASGEKGSRSADLFTAPRIGQSSNDYHPQLKQLLGEDEPMTFYSWHIHSYFFHEDANVTEKSLAFRDQFISAFNIPMCEGDCFMGGPFDTCDQGICVWDPVYGVDGPHPYGQWGVYLPNELLAQTLSWMSANHGDFLVFFHPNTGYMVGDHAPNKRAMWIGERQVPLDLDFLIWLQCEWFTCSDEITMKRALA